MGGNAENLLFLIEYIVDCQQVLYKHTTENSGKNKTHAIGDVPDNPTTFFELL